MSIAMPYRASTIEQGAVPKLTGAEKMNIFRLTFLVLLMGLGGSSVAQSSSAPSSPSQLWEWLRGGDAVALMRHALAPGTGDPANFTLGDCATQRNLSDKGRQQARAIGERFRRNRIQQARVYSSRWCRCLDTARLLGLGEAQPFDGLNSFFRDRSAEPKHSAATRRLINEQRVRGKPPLVLVTHQVNITALTGVFPSSGEIIVVRPTESGLSVLGRIEND
ncbi:MAG: histidine phosphatase family protein [Chromatiaceae bacterium]